MSSGKERGSRDWGCLCACVQERQFPLFPPWGQTTFCVADLNSGKVGGLSQLSQRVRVCWPLKWLHCLLHWTSAITLHCHALAFHLWSFVAELFVKRLQIIPNGGAFQHQTQRLSIYSKDSVTSVLRNWQKLLSCDAESRWAHEKQSTWHACCLSSDLWTLCLNWSDYHIYADVIYRKVLSKAKTKVMPVKAPFTCNSD